MTMQRLRRIGCAACVLVALTACGSDDPAEPAGGTAQQSAQPGNSNVIYATTFEDDAGRLFYTGETNFGARASITDGRYVVEVEDGEWQTITPGPMPHPRNGSIEADVTLTGTGFGGLVARSSVDAAGDDWMYVCLLDDTGWAGCVASVGDTYQDLFWGEIDGFRPGDTVRLRLTVVEDQIELAVNGNVIGSAQDASVQSGAWGVMAESQDETLMTVAFDNLSISVVNPGSVPATPTVSDERDSA